jgi:hypothetical protein
MNREQNRPHTLAHPRRQVNASVQQVYFQQWGEYLVSEEMARNISSSPEDELFNVPWLAVFKFDYLRDNDSANIPVEAQEAAESFALFLRKSSTLEKCCLFTTYNGSIGVLFGNIEKKNLHRLAFIPGLNRLLVLRTHGDKFVLVGHAFVESYTTPRDNHMLTS